MTFTPVKSPDSLTDQEAVTALCLYEEALARDNADRDATGDPDPLVRWREDNGIYALRDACVGLAPYAEAEWHALSEEARGIIVHDWEFIPEWLAQRVLWDRTLGVNLLDNSEAVLARFEAKAKGERIQ